MREDAMCTQLERSTYVIITLLKISFMRSQREEKKLSPADPLLAHLGSQKLFDVLLEIPMWESFLHICYYDRC